MPAQIRVRPVLTRACPVVAALALVGCSSYQPPTFEALSVREAERTDAHTVLVFEVRATNPNRDPMPLGRATFALRLGDETVFEGVRSPETTIDTYATNTFELPAVIPAGLISRDGLVNYALEGTVIYRRPGALADVLFDAQITVPQAPLNISGVIDLD
jgi:LEA14-like dessication related protein